MWRSIWNCIIESQEHKDVTFAKSFHQEIRARKFRTKSSAWFGGGGVGAVCRPQSPATYPGGLRTEAARRRPRHQRCGAGPRGSKEGTGVGSQAAFGCGGNHKLSARACFLALSGKSIPVRRYARAPTLGWASHQGQETRTVPVLKELRPIDLKAPI